MTKEVSILLKNIQTFDDGHRDTTEARLEGQYFVKNNKQYILYEECDPDTKTITKNTLKFDADTVELSRRGTVKSTMTFCTGTEDLAEYLSPFGSTHFHVFTHELSVECTENRIRFRIQYDLSQDETLICRNKMSVSVTSAANGR